MEFFKEFLRFLSVVLASWVGWVAAGQYMSRDATDSPTGRRSGLSLKIDHGTGVHYLQSWSGSLTPRLDRDGKVVVEAESGR